MRTRKPRRPSAGSSAVLWRDAILGCLAIDCYACHARGDVARVGVVPRVRSTCPGVDYTTTCALRQGSLVRTRTGRLRPRLSASAVRFSTVRGAQFACAATAQVNAPANSADERSWQALTSLSRSRHAGDAAIGKTYTFTTPNPARLVTIPQSLIAISDSEAWSESCFTISSGPLLSTPAYSQPAPAMQT
ncbi:uncharacterized protein CC84DRAFT_1174484 [Paraphaeosphaeria sporulosa]|uniref:Uncharacterized protein n=1 Tax=Paraphaeosphaeria sporulosa TaxID=1460663 RepID=A0A177CNM9_9PLEO|nr:uncharacterized protein CC84DRAFT_1174484 [Paraphaeosphaeria sporulosa]OAG09123.1 hypothetical protein CC84DRAFT_1174484 [Paraphaeosphaeria sporulosa]